MSAFTARRISRSREQVLRQAIKHVGIDDDFINLKLADTTEQCPTEFSASFIAMQKILQIAEKTLTRDHPVQDSKLRFMLGQRGYSILKLILKGDLVMLRRLINRNNANDKFGDCQLTALHLAAAVGSLAVLQEILAISDVDCVDKDGNTPLLLAVQGVNSSNDKDLLQLIEKLAIVGADVAKANRGGAISLHYLTINGLLDSTIFLLQSPYIDSYSAEQIIGALNLAMFFGNDVICDIILDAISEEIRQDIGRKIDVEDALNSVMQFENSWVFILVDPTRERVLKKKKGNDSGIVAEGNAEASSADAQEPVQEREQETLAPENQNIATEEQNTKTEDTPSNFMMIQADDFDKDKTFIQIQPDDFDKDKTMIASGFTKEDLDKTQVQQIDEVCTEPEIRFPDFEKRSRRYESFLFQNWPLKEVLVDSLVLAGFFYQGTGDEVCCFQCGGTLDRWVAQHDPWMRHLSTFPDCSFVKQNADDVITRLTQINEKLGGTLKKKPSALPRQPSSDSQFSSGSLPSTPNTVNPDLIRRSDLKVNKLLGEGGFGTVHKGFWRVSLCAIKKVNISIKHRVDKDTMVQEARIQSALRHPHIVNCFGISVEEDDIWMVMALVEGCGLNDFVNNDEKEIPFAEKLSVCLQMCDAIRYLHDDKGIVHNDIKPQNVLIQVQNGRYTSYISDFGISRYIGIDYQEFVTKFTKNCTGTFQYMAPECLQKKREGRVVRYPTPTFKSDAWSLGALLVELFTGDELYFDFNEINHHKILGKMPETFRKVPNFAKEILRKSLSVKSEERPTASELVTFFQQFAFLEGE